MSEFIEREALKEQLHKRLKNPVIISWLYSIIAEISTADVVEVVHSKWIRDSLTGHISCLNCKMTAPGDCELKDFYESDYCPMCGAKMDGKR